MINTLLLKAAIVRNDMSIKDVASKIGISKQALSYKINNKRRFHVDEVSKISDVLNLTQAEVNTIFFETHVD